MPIQCVEVTESNLREYLTFVSDAAGDTHRASVLALWKHLRVHPYFMSVAAIRTEDSQIVACASTAIVSARFTDEELANPRPGLDARFLEACAAGLPVVSSRDQVAKANAGAGVDFLHFSGYMRSGLALAEQLQIYAPLWAQFVKFARGHRIRTVFAECIDEFFKRSARAGGTPVVEFPETDSLLNSATREIVGVNPASVGTALFHYTEPVLRLRPAEQELLLAAVDGATDEELAAALGISNDAVKARWRSTLAGIAKVNPELVTYNGSSVGRGPQKRHRVLAYVREHPEELRPYDWTVANRNAARRSAPPVREKVRQRGELE
ncbi:MAG TPA: hypothetical protein VH088_08890 [Terriglobales bacterium]|jgi:hypothetical protein|nr:hypothetical protein [Terriglobales bacterium]